MKKYVKSVDRIIDTDITDILSVSLPYVLKINILANNNSIQTAEELELRKEGDIFEYPELLVSFANRVAEELSNTYNVSTAGIKVNKSNSSVYLRAAERQGNSLIELKAEIGYLLRISNHAQKLPYSQEVEESRIVTKNILVDFINKLFSRTISRTRKNTSDIKIKFPEIDYSITVVVSQDEEDDIEVKDIESAAKFIAKDMFEYIQKEREALKD